MVNVHSNTENSAVDYSKENHADSKIEKESLKIENENINSSSLYHDD